MATKMDKLLAEIDAQYKWIEDHGGNEVGYVRRYGSKNDIKHYGDGGEAIYAADVGALQNLLNRGYRAVGFFNMNQMLKHGE